jgi:hypothetical protein
MKSIVLFCVFCLQFSFSQESKIVIDNKLKGKELARKMSRVHDSLLIVYDSIAADYNLKEVFIYKT